MRTVAILILTMSFGCSPAVEVKPKRTIAELKMLLDFEREKVSVIRDARDSIQMVADREKSQGGDTTKLEGGIAKKNTEIKEREARIKTLEAELSAL